MEELPTTDAPVQGPRSHPTSPIAVVVSPSFRRRVAARREESWPGGLAVTFVAILVAQLEKGALLRLFGLDDPPGARWTFLLELAAFVVVFLVVEWTLTGLLVRWRRSRPPSTRNARRR